MAPTLGIILTGGAARRMGGSKLDRRLPGGARLLDVAAATLRAVRPDEVLAVGRPPLAGGAGGAGGAEADAAEPPGRLATTSGPVPLIADARPGEGPLAGLEAGLAAGRARGAGRLLVIPCDMPWLTPEDLRGLLEHPAALVHPATGGLPLAADVTPGLASAVAAALDAGRRRLSALLAAEGAAVVPVTGAALDRYANVNRPEDLRPGR